MLTGSTAHSWSLCHVLAKAGKVTRCPLWGHFRLGLDWPQEEQQCCALDGMTRWESGLGWGGC